MCGGRCGCVEVDVGVGMENPTPVQKFTYLEPDAIVKYHQGLIKIRTIHTRTVNHVHRYTIYQFS